MLRKIIPIITAVGAVAAIGLASAQAMPPRETKPPIAKPGRDFHHSHRSFFGSRFVFAPSYYGTYGRCWRKVWVETPHGLRRRLVDVCGY
jgi:hypothetical protein